MNQTIHIRFSFNRNGAVLALCQCGESREFVSDPASPNFLKRRSAIQQADEWATVHVIRDHAGCNFVTENELGQVRG